MINTASVRSVVFLMFVFSSLSHPVIIGKSNPTEQQPVVSLLALVAEAQLQLAGAIVSCRVLQLTPSEI